jgi:hypothetical protein
MRHPVRRRRVHSPLPQPEWDWTWDGRDSADAPNNSRLRPLIRVIKSEIVSLRRRRKTQIKSSPCAFPFLQLPRELREMIYEYFRPPLRSTHQVNNSSSAHLTLDIPYTMIDSPDQDDPIFFQPPTRYGILSLKSYEGGRLPCLALRMTCKQIHGELWDHMFSRVAEVGPLTPHYNDCRFDPTYENLKSSSLLPALRKIRVRVDLADLRLTQVFLLGLIYEEISLEQCVQKVQERAEKLVRVLRKGTKMLNTIVIDWKDDFQEDENWELKSSVLLPFGTLDGVQITLGDLLVSEECKTDVREKLEEICEGLSATS